LNQEIEEGLCALTVPVLDQSGEVVAASNVIGNLSRSSPKNMISRVLPQWKQAAQEINNLLWGKRASLSA
jgi:IclR family pca regulon transcriptional regulator